MGFSYLNNLFSFNHLQHMESIVTGIGHLFSNWKNEPADRIEKLPQSGSDRTYFRIYFKDETFIATYGLNVKENNTFINFSKHFKSKGLPVPEIFCVNDEQTIYIQEDLGTESLLNKLE